MRGPRRRPCRRTFARHGPQRGWLDLRSRPANASKQGNTPPARVGKKHGDGGNDKSHCLRHGCECLLGHDTWAYGDVGRYGDDGDGDRNVYYLHDNRPLYRSDDGEYPSPPDLFEALTRNEEEAIVIPHHTAHGGNFCDWKDHDDAYERLVEVFQIRGSYECSEQDGNPVPERQSSVPPYENRRHPEQRRRLFGAWCRRAGPLCYMGGSDPHRRYLAACH